MTHSLVEIAAFLPAHATAPRFLRGRGAWHFEQAKLGRPIYCAVLAGAFQMEINGQGAFDLKVNDFVLIPPNRHVTLTRLDGTLPEGGAAMERHPSVPERRTDAAVEPTVMLGHYEVRAPTGDLLSTRILNCVHLQGQRRVASLIQLIREEVDEVRAACDTVLVGLIELLYVETLRQAALVTACGVAPVLSDARIAAVIRQMHENPEKAWTAAELAKAAALSRSVFFERFSRTVGVAPMEYLTASRMALAKILLRQRHGNVTAVAARVGYASATAFSLAFTRHVGIAPRQYARGQFTPQ